MAGCRKTINFFLVIVKRFYFIWNDNAEWIERGWILDEVSSVIACIKQGRKLLYFIWSNHIWLYRKKKKEDLSWNVNLRMLTSCFIDVFHEHSYIIMTYLLKSHHWCSYIASYMPLVFDHAIHNWIFLSHVFEYITK